MEPIRIVETHISTLYFVDDLVVKRRKPVRTGFLDFSTLEAREADCRREVALNRRFAPDVYLGAVPVITPDGEVADYVSVMRRMPDDRRLRTLAGAGAGDECVDAVADCLAAVHRASTRSPESDAAATRDALAANWDRNLDQLEAVAVVDPARLREVRALAARYLAGRGTLFEARIAAGRAVDGHGDLLTDDVFCLDDGPRILDCLEFDERLRRGDGLLDAAFLAMDLEHVGRSDLATRFLARYRALMDDDAPASLAHHYVAYRAGVRALVAGLRHTGDEAREFLALALSHLRASRVRMVLMGGAPGTGKSTVAAGVSERRGWELLRSDVVRTKQPGPARYDDAAVAANYTTLIEQARHELERGRSVVLDATWGSTDQRAAAAAAADGVEADLVAFECVLDPAVADRRIRARRAHGGDASDADEQVAARLRATFAPWPAATPLDTSVPVADAVAAALGAVADA